MQDFYERARLSSCIIDFNSNGDIPRAIYLLILLRERTRRRIEEAEVFIPNPLYTNR